MKLGIIGSGIIVQELIPRLAELDGIEIVAVQGVKDNEEQVEKLCRENGITHAVYDFESLCAAGIDTIYIAVPNYLHFTYSKQALECGMNVIVEKPIASNLKEVMYLEKAAKEKQLFIFEAVTTIYFENFKKIKEWLPKIGTIKIVQAQYSQYSRRYDAFRNGEILPVFDPAKSGGALMDLNLYNLYLVVGLFGKPQHTKYYANIERGVDTSGILMLEYPEFQAFCLAAKDSRGISGAIIQGTNGCIRTGASPNGIGKITLELNDGTVEEFDDGMINNRLIPEFTAFIDAINANDLSFCYKMLEKSIEVNRIQTNARLKAGIYFAADGVEI